MQSFSCPHCGGEFHVSENAVGHNVPCPFCERSMFVPTVPDESYESSSVSDYPAPRRMKPGTFFGILIIGSCLAIGAMLAGVALVRFWAYPGNEPQASPSGPMPQTQKYQPVTSEPSSAADHDKEIAFLGLSAFLSWLLFFVFVGLSVILIQILILVWVVRDARARGMEGAIWLIVVLLAPALGLLVYIASRPAGTLVRCRNCGNNRLEYLRACPICQHSKTSRRRVLSGGISGCSVLALLALSLCFLAVVLSVMTIARAPHHGGSVQAPKPQEEAQLNPDYFLSAQSLFSSYCNNRTTADIAYNGKVLEVNGTVARVGHDEKGDFLVYAVIRPHPPGPISLNQAYNRIAAASASGVEGVRCYFRPGKAFRAKAGAEFSLRGQCRGMPLNVEIHDCVPLTRTATTNR